jgi:CRISPR-associated protein Csb2
MTLVLDVEYLAAVSFAALGRDSDAPDWPPQPDRIFSALVASWAARGALPAEAAALEWLENLPAPQILASGGAPRSAPTVFVPPNDPRSEKQKNAEGVLPALRPRQPRRFPAWRPDDPIIRLFWTDAHPNQETLAALQRMAHDTAYVGHSSSLTRCCFRCIDDSVPSDAIASQRRIYPGRFVELQKAFEAGRRPAPGAHVVAAPRPPLVETLRSLFAADWLLLEHVDGDMPDIRAAALVAKTIRDTLLAGYERIGLRDQIPEVVSGHAASGGPTKRPHLAIVPLAFTGFPHADGHLMGFALVPPRDDALLEDDAFRNALRRLAPVDEHYGRRIMTVKAKGGTSDSTNFLICLSPTFEPPAGKRSLDRTLYCAPAQTFASVLPIVLDRHLKEKGEARQDETAAQIAAACRNIGLPEPVSIVPDKHSAIEGAPSAYPSGGAPSWMRWRVPATLTSRSLTHAVIRFAKPIAGPVILGAGRFVGLGLCRPLDAERTA